MRSNRFSIAGLMGAVLVAALGLAALRYSTETWAGVVFLVTCGMLSLAIVGVVCRGQPARAWWLGFALFGWGYLFLAFWSTDDLPALPTMALLEVVCAKIGVAFPAPGGGLQAVGLGGMRGVVAGGFGGNFVGRPTTPFWQIGHCLWALLAAVVGGLLARALFGAGTRRSENTTALEQSPVTAPPKWWLRPRIVVLAGLAVLMFVAVAGWKSAAGLVAGTAFLLACGLIGFAGLGALLSRGKRREFWLAAFLFGAGYMILVFAGSPDYQAFPRLPTVHILNSFRRWIAPVVNDFPADSDSVAAANARILKALEQQVPMKFREETPLEDVLKYVQNATRGPDGNGIPIYVDPIGLQEAEKSMTSVVHLDLEGVRLGTSLRLCLKQLDLAYRVRDGLLLITFQENSGPTYEDPYLIAGQCLLALVAAGLGGLLAPFVSELRRRPGG